MSLQAGLATLGPPERGTKLLKSWGLPVLFPLAASGFPTLLYRDFLYDITS